MIRHKLLHFLETLDHFQCFPGCQFRHHLTFHLLFSFANFHVKFVEQFLHRCSLIQQLLECSGIDFFDQFREFFQRCRLFSMCEDDQDGDSL